MDLMVNMKALRVLRKIMLRQTDNVSAVTYSPQKDAWKGLTDGVWHFPVSTPEEQGISSAYLEQFFRDMGSALETGIHSLYVVRNGHAIASGSFAPYREGLWHVSHSLCKSVTSLGIGILIDEGKLTLDEKLNDIFQGKTPLLSPSLFHKDITVRHLLTMSSGVAFNEIGAIAGDDWLKLFLESNRQFEPGGRFAYNSMNTYVLSAIVQERSGETLFDYLKARLFTPLGIRNVYWEPSPQGITKGGWGLYLCAEDMAKLGQLYLNGGMWEGTRIISGEWLKEASAKQIEGAGALYGYGYQVWQGRQEGTYLFNGMLGQNVFIMPQTQTIVVTQAGSSEFFGTGTLTETVYRYFQSEQYQPADHALTPNPTAYESLQRTLRSLTFHQVPQEAETADRGGWLRQAKLSDNSRRGTRPQYLHRRIRLDRDPVAEYTRSQTFRNRLNGTAWTFEKNAVGILPLFVQVMHNNYTTGTSQMSFSVEKDVLTLTMVESNAERVIRIGLPRRGYPQDRFGTAQYSTLDIAGEIYEVGSNARFVTSKGRTELEIQMCFIETSNSRTVRVAFAEDGNLDLQWNEYPTLERLAQESMKEVSVDAAEAEPNGITKILADLGFGIEHMIKVLAPELTGVPVPEETDRQIEE